MTDDTLERGIAAVDETVELLTRARISKALDPLKPRDYLVILNRLTKRLEGVTKQGENAAMRAALDSLDVRWASMGPERIDKVIAAANQVLRKRVAHIPAKVEAVLKVEGPRISKATRASMNTTFDLGIETNLDQRDIRVEKAVRVSTINFIRDNFGDRADELSERARNIVARGLSRGYGSDQIGQLLRMGLGDRVSQSSAYWRMIAGSFATHARTSVQVGALEDARVESYLFQAVLDEATSAVCRHYHGKVFTVGAARSQVERVAELSDPEQIVNVSPWVREGRARNGDSILYVKQGKRAVRIATIERSGVGRKDDVGEFTNGKSTATLTRLGILFPPLHGHCRSTIVPA